MTVQSPFLTDLDTRAAVKGSRDPMGAQSIWTKMGRQVVGNLTTVSTSVRDFTTLLLGYHFATRASDAGGPESELDVFLKWEQLAAYARGHVNRDWAFRGVDRVKKRLGESTNVRLSADSAGQILSNQKTYGLWGLYTVAGRASGLLDGEPTRLTPRALQYVERECLPILKAEKLGDGARILEILRQPSSRIDIEGRDRQVVRAVARILDKQLRKEERSFYREHLLTGGPSDSTSGRQHLLAELFGRTKQMDPFTPKMMTALAKEARAHGESGQPLAAQLDRIRAAESLLAPVAALFAFVLAQDDITVDQLAAILKKQWGATVTTVEVEALSLLTQEFGNNGRDDGEGERWLCLAKACAAGNYTDLVNLLIRQNQEVMLSRGGAPWVSLEKNRLQVRVRDETAALPRRTELPNLWRHSYFIDSLRTVTAQLRGGTP